ncbi:hypothetical protein [Methanoregula sp.]|uniref:hypothetical protein n=1 Tax=Methanoregula sp. TaxID=2052170 RepID=UPI002B6AE0AF|nr:hypothetical protein [Methanoregula sp.]HVP96734.1 hypothetical protein [Methanoregula sp.]
MKVEEVDEQILTRVLDIQFPGKSLKSPIKAINKATSLDGLNEIFHEVTPKNLEEIKGNSTEERIFNQKIQKGLVSNSINFVLLRYTGEIVPKPDDMETLVDLQYVYSDAAIIPSCPGLFKNDDSVGCAFWDTFIEYVGSYLQTVETLNKKTVIGLIPHQMPRTWIPTLLDYYHDRDITSFIIDSDRSSLYSNLSWIQSIQRALRKLNIIDEGFIYDINSERGKFLKNADVVLAKDFVGLGLGVDILGNMHLGPRLDATAWKKIKTGPYRGPRVFDPETYGYMRIPALTQPVANTENIRRQYGELIKIRSVLKENSTVADYLNTKELIETNQVTERVRDFKKHVIESRTAQSTLFDAG